jgi:hypothetical protein
VDDGSPALGGADAGLDLVTLGGVARLLVPRGVPSSFRRSAFGLLQGLRPPQSWLWAAAGRGWTVPLPWWPVRIVPTTLDRAEDELFTDLVGALERWAGGPLHVAALMSQGRGLQRCGVLLGRHGAAEAFAKVGDLDDGEYGGQVDRELDAMQRAAKLRPRSFTLPEVVDELSVGARRVVIMEHLPQRHEGRHAWDLPFAIAGELRTLHESDVPGSVPAESVAPTDATSPGLASAARFLLGRSEPVHLSVGHGDLAPWNIRYRRDDARPVLLDWEHFAPDMPVFADPAAMVYARWLVYGRQRSESLTRDLLATGRETGASPVDVVAGITWLFQRRRQFLTDRLDAALAGVVASLA